MTFKAPRPPETVWDSFRKTTHAVLGLEGRIQHDSGVLLALFKILPSLELWCLSLFLEFHGQTFKAPRPPETVCDSFRKTTHAVLGLEGRVQHDSGVPLALFKILPSLELCHLSLFLEFYG